MTTGLRLRKSHDRIFQPEQIDHFLIAACAFLHWALSISAFKLRTLLQIYGAIKNRCRGALLARFVTAFLHTLAHFLHAGQKAPEIDGLLLELVVHLA